MKHKIDNCNSDEVHLISVPVQISAKKRRPTALGHGVGNASTVQAVLQRSEVLNGERNVSIPPPVLRPAVNGVGIGQLH